jgi:hypothetical protein
MIDRLRSHGFGRQVRDLDLSTLDLPEERIS